ncbi:hypothetical protein NW754_009997 [Fusarium falciforme]|uniref:Uncharacterized protein n=1 Tax=Fusarium falciforme TaxID=195108 RepID=A0A9W8RB88_9HYPO|nr:hypothetical protein NW754_009997 [Fusarium falciforme]KAJ4190592.1 hypothetical protein NW767_011212 [Fusarium falciforme]KAJ4190769.1 hypothetical protein NW755_004982 [Fusarium falciforme]KAJ4257190.1 hypothetical protein NW757_003812 [Fusarium falciforme]
MWQPSSEEKTAGFMIKKESERRKRRSLTRDGIIIIYLPQPHHKRCIRKARHTAAPLLFWFLSFLASLLPQTIISLWTIFGIPSYAHESSFIFPFYYFLFLCRRKSGEERRG